MAPPLPQYLLSDLLQFAAYLFFLLVLLAILLVCIAHTIAFLVTRHKARKASRAAYETGPMAAVVHPHLHMLPHSSLTRKDA